MRVLIQRVTRATVTVDGEPVAAIGPGLLVLLGIETDDLAHHAHSLAAKTARLRIFDDEQGVMNRSLIDVKGEALVVSQFTLMASTRRGNRPSYIRAAPPRQAEPLYREFVAALEHELGRRVATGRFGAQMQVSLVNSGPVTIWIDSKQQE